MGIMYIIFSDGDGGIREVDNQDQTSASDMGMEFKGRGKMEMGNSLVGPHEVLVGIHQRWIATKWDYFHDDRKSKSFRDDVVN